VASESDDEADVAQDRSGARVAEFPADPRSLAAAAKFFGWLLCRTGTTAAVQGQDAAAFEPSDVRSAAEVMADFDFKQNALVARVEACDAVDISRARMSSAFSDKVKHNVYSGFRVVASHQRRHLWQAESVMKEPANI